MSHFLARVETALKDEDLKVALGRATDRLGSRRSASLASLENSDMIRDMARRAKMGLLADLAGNLETFEKNLIKNGVKVHWAEDGKAANKIMVRIAKERNCKRAVKSKSMATEETHLNHDLLDAGVDVLETDLGEYIVQLAETTPSHIILPIIHMTKEKIGEIMHRKIQVPYTSDPGKLAKIARAKLREAFLSADLGITGANFGVIDSGAIVLVSNEGNARLVTTLPRVHVVVMGIEKLVPSLADLDLMVKILGRSATGQKITTYTSLVTGPRRPGETDGCEEMHVILLDNGRSRILGGPIAEILGCIRCGACLNACPVYKNIGGHAYGDTYPGPVGAIVTPGLRGIKGWKALPDASSLCGACKEVCPVRLDIPRMLLELRKHAVEEAGIPWSLRIGLWGFGMVASRPWLYKPGARLGGIAARLLAPDGWIKKLPGLAGGWTRSRDMKAPAAKTFQQLFRERKRPAAPAAKPASEPASAQGAAHVR
ncbi:MAG TPA: LutB/LldF family L-lactate oxidation iron-sulfur protein [Fibrobacteria bacterium]|nr:LutB/LldF family L-lactate oxidation iron-sulfur protein [Fibrobacteria bacterium]